MFSRLYIKISILLVVVLLAYAAAVFFIIIPAVKEKTVNLEEENGKAQLAKIAVLIDSYAKSIDDYKQISLNAHKNELENLTDVTEALVKDIYKASLPAESKEYLAKEGKDFRSMLLVKYQKELKLNGKEAARKAVIEFINDYRYDNEIGYFYALQKDTRVVIHPIIPSMNGKHYTELEGTEGKPLKQIPEIVNGTFKNGSAFVTYTWPNHKTKKIENKLLYGLLFEPLNWVLVTGFYLPEVTKSKQKEAIEFVKNLSYSQTDYFFISNYNYILVSHPYLQGEDFSNVRDVYGNLVIPPAVKLAREKGDGFTRYWWKKNIDDDTPYEKLLYSRNFPQWGWVISTGVYLDDVQKEVELRKKQLVSQLHDVLKNTKIGESGYVYIFDADAKVIIHPDPEWEGNSMSELINPDSGNLLFEELIGAYNEKEKKLNYKWEKLRDKGNFNYDKISWIEYNPYFKWYICSSAYMNEFNKTSNNLRVFILLITVIMLSAGFFFGIIAFRKLLRPIVYLSNKTQLIKKGDFSIRSEFRSNDEIGTLAETFDEMLDTIEDNIKMLDKKVYYKTKELTQTNQRLEKSIEDLKDAQKQLVESEKMAALGGLVAGVSHEINTPVGMALTGITHILDEKKIISQKYQKGEMTEEDFDEFMFMSQDLGKSIELNLHRAANLVRSFKQVAVDQSSEEMRVFKIKEYLKEILTSLHNKIKSSGHRIELDIEDDFEIKNYPGAFSQIITNLIMNSLVHGYDKKENGNIVISISKSDDILVINYKDDGKGIPLDHLHKIYEPFFTTNREQGGSGLGMNIVYNIVTQQLKGDIICESTPGKGVNFKITFPCQFS